MLRASLFRLPVIVTFLTAAAFGMVLELLGAYLYSVPDVNSFGSHLTSYRQRTYNRTGSIASQSWHSHNVEGSEAVSMRKTIRVLCLVTIHQPTLLGVAFGDTFKQDTWTAVQTVVDTWGKRCSQLIMFGNVPDIKVDSMPFLAVKSDRADSWKSLTEVLSQASSSFDMKFDWLLKVDVNTFVVLENLRYFVSSLDPSFPFYLGHTLSNTWGTPYNSADAGILMSRATLLHLQKALAEGVCTHDESHRSDVELGSCLAKISIFPQDTRDANGHARFLPFDPKAHLLKEQSSWFRFLWTQSKYPIKEGPECCSDYAITFHNVPPREMTVMEFFLYHLDAFSLSSKLASHSPPPP